MLGRRFLLLVAVLMGLTALAASVAPREPLMRDRRTVAETIETEEDPAKVTVRKGDLVRLEVRGNELDSVRLFDEIEPIDVNSPAIFELYADRPGSYPIELVEGQRQVGTLVVRE